MADMPTFLVGTARSCLRAVVGFLDLGALLALRATCRKLWEFAGSPGVAALAAVGAGSTCSILQALAAEPLALSEAWACELAACLCPPRAPRAFVAACRQGRAAIARRLWLGLAGSVRADCARTGLGAAALHGHAEVVQWLWFAASAGGATPPGATTALQNACAWGHVEVAEWVRAEIEVASDGSRALEELRREGLGTLAAVCGTGNLTRARLAARLVDVSAVPCVPPHACPMWAACDAQSLEVAQWVWGLMGAGARAAFVEAANAADHLDDVLEGSQPRRFPLARWLSTLGLVRGPLGGRRRPTIRDACAGASLDDVRWLWSIGYGLEVARRLEPEHDISARNALGYACSAGRIDVAEWLWGQGFTLEDARAGGRGSALAAACHAGQLEAARWLWGRGLAAGDAGRPSRGGWASLLREALSEDDGVTELARWLWSVAPDLAHLRGHSESAPRENALHEAASAGNLGALEWLRGLRDAGGRGLSLADVRALDDNGRSVLACARLEDRGDAVEWLRAAAWGDPPERLGADDFC